ncbi:type IV toxin-antitoxin system AbiEi family antitoxin domain-containing protein [Tsukamurella tyrosinosolvens]|uniref:type IV toxin-antitoxin system AbiEi family antitoxin domain-containing protein n=1 Tax=Tsukamurella tyrosinosolvens TaxID=57704 RepID=UPI001AF52FC2|nr:type IV toxin-antitoxin system AbiEi family antitoxin domain-containing protein [Tsukamurella tyrosinosolvens]QRY85718.1 type IV toxin-antitoxin system AbiEi family antitoxin domain-containing protein [Tsukamurella tyrosinosolvens]
MGINANAFSRAVARGTVHPTGNRGVYSVFAPELLSARDRLQAAWTAIDLTAPPWERVHQAANIVSHHTALDLHAGRPPGEPFEFVLGSTSRLIDRPGIIAHRQPIDPGEVTHVDGLPVQTVGTAIVDLMRTYRPHPEEPVARLLASTVAAGVDWSDVPERLGYVLGNPWSKHDTRQILADLFTRTAANPELVGSAILGVDWHRVGFWRIQINKNDNRTAITGLFIDALTHACTALAAPDRAAAAIAAEEYLQRFAAATRERVALFDGTRQERVRLRVPEAREVTRASAVAAPATTPLPGTAIGEAREIVADIARSHHSIVTAAEAGRHGVTPQQLRTFVAEGLIHRTNNRGVYTTLPHPLTHLHRLRAAWYAADTRTPMDERPSSCREVITGPTAEALHAGKVPGAPYHLALGSKTRHLKRADVIAHRTRPLTPADITLIRDLPVTTEQVTRELSFGSPGRNLPRNSTMSPGGGRVHETA